MAGKYSVMQRPPEEDRENPADRVIDIQYGSNLSPLVSSNVTLSNGSESLHNENARMRNGQANVARNSSSFANRSNVPTLSVHKALISIKLAFKIMMIISSMIVLIVSRHENPRYPLFAWIACYAVGCAASLPITCRIYFFPHFRFWRLLERLEWLLGFLFAFWFAVGNFWVVGENSPHEAENLYGFGIMLLFIHYIKYTWFCILQAILLLCCWRRLTQTRKAAAEIINALPIYRFKLQRNGRADSTEVDGSVNEFGVVAAGTEKERALSMDDAICSICLEIYDDNDKLRELPCSHLFHAKCVGTWLKIKASCPLCKCSVGRDIKASPSPRSSVQQV